MYWHIDLRPSPATVQLMDVDNFRAFQIEATGPREAMAAALAPYGRWEDDHGWFDPDAVRRAAGDRAADPAWQEGFEAMTAYAREHDYLADDGFLRAHVEWQD